MPNWSGKNLDWSSCGALPDPARHFVLFAIVENRSNVWISEELQSRYKIHRSPYSIRYYKFHPKWKAELERVRHDYENALKDEPFASKRFVFSCCSEAYELAFMKQDVRTLMAIIRRASEMIGHNRKK